MSTSNTTPTTTPSSGDASPDASPDARTSTDEPVEVPTNTTPPNTIPLDVYSFGIPPTHELLTFAGSVSASVTKMVTPDVTPLTIREHLTGLLRQQAHALLVLPDNIDTDISDDSLHGGLLEVGYSLSQEEDELGITRIVGEARGTVAILTLLSDEDIRPGMQPLATTIPQALSKFNLPDPTGPGTASTDDATDDLPVGLYL